MDIVYKNKRNLVEAVVGPNDTVLEVGFWGQTAPPDKPGSLHRILIEKARAVYGIDCDFDENVLSTMNDVTHYLRADVEEFVFADMKFDVIIASELIEHLSNPGRFLDACTRHLSTTGKLVLTTPNCFNFFSITGKFMHREPYVSADHTCYFNEPTLRTLLRKHELGIASVDYIHALDMPHKVSIKQKLLNALYGILVITTPKYAETLVVIAKKL